ncbi:15768_t:CDS:10 [Entrophospora sp. SA101]|nr:15768_t:CDS:10 [Entrophospora sp. SA101]
MTKLFYEPKRINERKGTEPLALVCMRFSCLIISMIILMVFFAFMVYSVASDGRITTSVIIPKPYIPIPDLVINANFSFSMDCQLQYLDGRAISQTDKDSCSNYIVPTVCNEPDPNDLSKGRCTGKFQVPTELLDAPLTERLSFSLPDKRYGIQFLINITDDVPYDPKYDNGIIVKAYDQEFNPHRLPEAVNNLISKIDPCFIDRLDSLNFHMLAHHQSRCIGKFQVPTELLDAPITERLNFSLPDKRYGIQFLINITDAEYNPKYDNGIVIKAYDQEFNPHRLPEAVGNLVNKLDPYFIERLDSLNFHIMTYHQTREFLITSFWEMLGLPPYYFLQPYIDSRIEYIRIPSIIDQFATSNYGILFVGTLNWIETIESDLRIYNNLDSIALISLFYSLLTGVYTFLFGWSAIVPWGICQRSCCSSGSKAKLCKKFESRGIPLMP